MNTEKKLIREIHPEIKVLDATEGRVRYIASDETLDCYREVILANGWKFNRFKKNAPFVDSHNYDCVDRLLGRVETFEVKGKQLIEDVRWAIDTASELAKLGFDLTVKGYLKAVSVGFMPVRVSFHGDDDFGKAAEKAGLSTEQAAQCRAIYLEHEQIELSACIIGANPNALAKAWADGEVTEERMAAMGFDNPESLSFLESAAKVWDSPECDELMRTMIRLELRRTFKVSSASGSPARKPHSASDPKCEAQAEMRAKFLRELQANALSLP